MMSDWFDLFYMASISLVAVVELVYLMKANDRIETLERKLRKTTDPKPDIEDQMRALQYQVWRRRKEEGVQCECANCFVIRSGHKHDKILRCHMTREIIFRPEGEQHGT